MENIRNRTDIKFAQTSKLLTKWTSSPMCGDTEKINDDLVLVQMKKAITLLNKPIYVGMCILDLSKVHMYNFHYNFIVKKYESSATLLFTDTDSLAYIIETEDVYEDMKQNSELFDTSELIKSNPLYSSVNKKVIGKFKDECGNYIMSEFAGTRSKSYTFEKLINNLYTEEQVNEMLIAQTSDMDEEEKAEFKLKLSEVKKTLKGIKKSVVKNDISLQDYVDCVKEGKTKSDTMITFRSFKQLIFTLECKKQSLNPFDNKRWMSSNGIDTLAFGHYSII